MEIRQKYAKMPGTFNHLLVSTIPFFNAKSWPILVFVLDPGIPSEFASHFLFAHLQLSRMTESTVVSKMNFLWISWSPRVQSSRWWQALCCLKLGDSVDPQEGLDRRLQVAIGSLWDRGIHTPWRGLEGSAYEGFDFFGTRGRNEFFICVKSLRPNRIWFPQTWCMHLLIAYVHDATNDYLQYIYIYFQFGSQIYSHYIPVNIHLPHASP